MPCKYKKKKKKFVDDIAFKAYPKSSGFDFEIGIKKDRKRSKKR